MIGIGAAIAPRFKKETTGLKKGSAHFMVAACILAVCLLTHMPLVVVMVFYMYLMSSFGLMQPGLTATALDAERENAGAASAIFGASGFVAGAVSSPIVALGNIAVTSSCVMVAGTIICIMLTFPLCNRIKKLSTL